MLDLLSKCSVVIGNTFVLLILTVSIMFALWFITLPLCAFCIYCWYRQKAVSRSSSQNISVSRSRRSRNHSPITQRFLILLVLFPFAITLSIAALGGNFWSNPNTNTTYYWVRDIVGVLVWLHFPISGAAVLLARQQRLFVAALSIFQLWMSCCAGFVSAMTTTGQFL